MLVRQVRLEFFARFRRVVFVDEFLSSKACRHCHRTENVVLAADRTKTCSSPECVDRPAEDRDVHACWNILAIVRAYVCGNRQRPAYLSRSWQRKYAKWWDNGNWSSFATPEFEPDLDDDDDDDDYSDSDDDDDDDDSDDDDDDDSDDDDDDDDSDDDDDRPHLDLCLM